MTRWGIYLIHYFFFRASKLVWWVVIPNIASTLVTFVTLGSYSRLSKVTTGVYSHKLYAGGSVSQVTLPMLYKCHIRDTCRALSKI